MFPLTLSFGHALQASAEGFCALPDTVGKAMAADSTGRMERDGFTLGEVVVDGSRSKKEVQMRSSLNTVGLSKSYIGENFSGSLMQTLAKVPGVKAMDVGSGESKPVIRGLGFNRVVVTENGIKHVGQEWGDDHGLETDQFAVDNVEVVKGPAALMYGSDAIGGVINLRGDAVPQRRFGGAANVFARTNNEQIGTSASVLGREGRLWYKATATATDYADYRIPVDSIQYYSYYIKLKDRRLRNTAGRELDGNLVLGYEGEGFRSSLRVSEVSSKSGFFANAHGLEVLMSDIDYDRSRRDVDLPYHTVSHFVISNHSEKMWRGGRVEGDFAYQDNRQRELSEPISHGYMPIPPGTLERSFVKKTLSASLRLHAALGRHMLQAGLNAEYQHNRRGGWGFILPDFEQMQLGGYVADRLVLSDNLILSAGLRFDHGRVRIHSYRDWYKTPAESGDSVFMERSADLGRAFNSITWSVGVNRSFGAWVLKANVGKGFRMPIAKELGMDGINYNIFRYEKGNAGLSPEESYQVDGGVVYERGGLSFEFTPYFNYFPNYIYLSPTAEYREGLQLYNYTQSRVLRWGFEADASWRPVPCLELNAGGEYLYARQLSGDKEGYGLPFSTPWSARVGLRYDLPSEDKRKGGFAAMEFLVVGRQDDVVPPEEPTPGHGQLNASVGKSFGLGRTLLKLTLQGDNLLGKRFYDHTSYYRLIGVPEPGRNFSLMASWQF